VTTGKNGASSNFLFAQMGHISMTLNSEHLLQTFSISDTTGTQYISSAISHATTHNQLLVEQTLCPNSQIFTFYLDDAIPIGNATGTTNL
jgi:hypothetical protein